MSKSSPSESLVQRLVGIFDASNEGLWFMSVEGEVTFYTPMFYEQFDIDLEHVTFSDWMQLIHPLDRKAQNEAVDKHFDYDDRVESQYRIKTRSGRYIWIQATGVVKTENGRNYMVGSHKDISDQKLMEEYLYQAAYFDNATGLYNRKKLIVDIDESENQYAKTIFYISIDDIKSYINQYGDGILDDVANHVIGSFNVFSNYNCQFYKVASDEFAVVVNEDLTDNEIKLLCSNCIEKYHNLSNEDGLLYGDEMSLGVYRFVPKEMPAHSILRWASRTCEYAKAKLDDCWAVCDKQVELQVERHFYIERELKQVITSKSLSVKYQPIVSVGEEKILSFEALVRWESDLFGEIYPDEFIPIAEKKGLIFDLGCVVLEKAAQFIKRYNKGRVAKVRINVNVSVLQLLNSHYIASVEAIIAKIHIPRDWVVLELTETVLLDGVTKAKSQLEQLRSLGYKISLDDFGAGYSSLNSFFSLPLDQIKIDRTLTLSALESIEPLNYLKFLFEMCKEHDVSVVIEGIESENMALRMIEVGLDNLQGYWFSRPISDKNAFDLEINWEQIRSEIMVLSE